MSFKIVYVLPPKKYCGYFSFPCFYRAKQLRLETVYTFQLDAIAPTFLAVFEFPLQGAGN
jgi:hypothetical protein